MNADAVRPTPAWRAIALTLISAALFAAAFPLRRWWMLAWVALAPFFVAVRSGSTRRAIGLAWAWSVVAAYLIGDWMPRAVSVYYEQPYSVGVAFFAGCATTMAAPYYATFAVLYRRLAARRGSLQLASPFHQSLLPLLAAAAWVAAELGRGRLFTGTPFFIGNPWGLIGYSQVGVLPMMQVAAVTGVYGISFVIACVNAALAEVWLDRTARALRGLALAATLAIVAIVYGMTTVPGEPSPDVERPIAIVQPNLDLGTVWNEEFYGRNLDEYLRLTQQAQRATPAVVFWPEGAMTFLLEREALYRHVIGYVLSAHGTELVAGGPTAIADQPGQFFNSIFVIGPDGEIRSRYDKEYLVPFAEYFPFGFLDLLRRRFAGVRTFVPGSRVDPLPTTIGAAAIATCNEAMLPEVVGRRVAAGGTFLVNPSNDTWTSDAAYSAMQFDIVSMRAVEQRRYLVRASTAGPSAIVDPWGRVRVQSAPLTRDVVSGGVAARTDRTVYSRIGDLFALVCTVIAFAGAWRRPRRGDASEDSGAQGSGRDPADEMVGLRAVGGQEVLRAAKKQ